ncbi:phytanoyl-CoA dioxygenase family protein [Oceanibacterium hippocampi]|uniref:Phytanoyl-CoA dioxygenase (PhyH) n=1 Tax=Oceanibacterium hippocampi TaxID=745714 RepID=A0A1Y5U0H4_9PROT|nr:phytanoyl-CoA dioxygenase family protein [Oceanibacterium hippocampi]SLN73053.1 Phytanoyl-CoA dioxygenase (PhyH) [Oceanibacterium hippocampi]
MHLTEEQIAEYRDKGYVLVPGVLSAPELEVLDAAVKDLGRHDGPEVMREKDGKPHVVYGMHLLDERFGTLSRHPGLVGPAEQLLGKQIYVHQSRVNVKQMGGAIVDWHQDFGTYNRVDGVPEPDGLMISILLDEVTACNAPLMLVPRTQKIGIVQEARVNRDAEDHSAAAKYRYDIPLETLERLVREQGLEAITGPAGSVLFMNMNVVHGSTVNITPLRRVILYLNVCSVDNCGRSFKRPEYLAARDFSPILPLGEDCLLRYRDNAAK